MTTAISEIEVQRLAGAVSKVLEPRAIPIPPLIKLIIEYALPLMGMHPAKPARRRSDNPLTDDRLLSPFVIGSETDDRRVWSELSVWNVSIK